MSKNVEVDRKTFGRIDYIKITILGFGLNAFWTSLGSIVLPLRLLDFVPESLKNSYLGYLTFTGLILAMVTQPIVGAFSDRSSFAWGRRRPYILVGIAFALFFIPGIGLWGTYATIFITYCLLQISCNTAQAPYQGFIPDLVPEDKRGLASGVKTLELLGGIMFVRLVAYFMDRYSTGGEGFWLWGALGVLATVLLGTMLATVLTVKEQPGTGGPRLPILPSLLKSFQVDIKQNRDFIWFLVSRAVMSVPTLTLETYALYYVMDVIAPDDAAALTADLLIVVGITLMVTAYFAGRWSDKVGRKPILVSSGIIGALGILSLYLSKTHIYVMLSGVLLGVASGAFFSANWALATDLLPQGEEAKYMGLTNLALTAGAALARLIGPLIDFFNAYGHNLGYSVMLLICFVCFVGGALLLLKIREAK